MNKNIMCSERDKPVDKISLHRILVEPSDDVLGKDGVVEFYWPYTRREVIDFEECLSERYCKIIARASLDEVSALLLKIMQKYFVCEAVGLFQACLLKQRSQKDGVEFDFTGLNRTNWRLWPAILRSQIPEKPEYHKKLMKGPVQSSAVKKIFKISNLKRAFKILRFKKKGLSVNGLSIRPLTPKILSENIISTQRLPVISDHAKETNEDVIFSRSERFFSPIPAEELKTGELKNAKAKSYSDILDELIKEFDKISLENGCLVEPQIIQYFSDLCYEQYDALSIHFERLLNSDIILPKRLWIGTGGHVWDALLACAVRLKGGYVCGHSHGSGLAHIFMGFAGFIDLWLCGEYWTFCKGQAQELSNSVLNWAYMGGRAPSIHSPRQEKKKYTSSLVAQNNQPLQKKTIYVLSTIYDRDRGRQGPLMPDVTQIDWQARLVDKLVSWGYHVVIKAHPESLYPPPKTLEKLGAMITQEPFEAIMEKADVFLFDFIYTSVFRAAISTNKPIVITDFEDIPWTENAQKMIDKRCSILSGGFDTDNRVQIDWNKLQISIEQSFKKKNNHEFLSHYYNDSLIS